MELLLSNFKPINIAKDSSRSYVEKTIKNCRILKIASGYISSDALIELKRIVELNRKPRIELLIGMHYFDGFTKTQYEAAIELNDYLINNNLGFVYLSNIMKFHGKMYSFTMNGGSESAIVGSSNLGSIYDKVNRLYEADILLIGNESKIIHNSISQIIQRIGSPLEQIEITSFNEFNKLLDNHDNVKKVGKDDLTDISRKIKNSFIFEIPVKTEPKSHLNIFFGKGRVDKRGYEIPRPWYEAEIIVSNKITSQPGFPKNKSFTVYTDDGWSFECETHGDFSKNFRSKYDLKILGKWIKGRLEENGALKIGSPVTNEVLRKYGRNSLSLCATKDPNIWFLDFHPINESSK